MTKTTRELKDGTLTKLTTEMKGLYESLSRADSLTEGELHNLSTKAYDCLGDFESYFCVRIPTIRPEVPEEARTLFVSLFKLVDGLDDGK
jgi:hypothetical protein